MMVIRTPLATSSGVSPPTLAEAIIQFITSSSSEASSVRVMVVLTSPSTPNSNSMRAKMSGGLVS